MGRKKRAPVSKRAAAAKAASASKQRAPRPAAPANGDGATRGETLRGHIIERPDGFYWQSKEARAEYGPFATLAEAEANMLSGGAETAEEAQPADSLQEAESELGIAEWIDPDTGGPAEDSVPRIEDH